MATAMVLIAGGVVSLLLAGRLLAALLGWEIGPLAALSTLSGELLAALLLTVAILALAALVAMIPGQRQRVLWVPGERGGVCVPLAALQRLAEGAALKHPDVVRADVRLRERDGAPVGSLRLYARPLADAGRVAADVKARAQREIDLVIGRAVADLEVDPKVLRVNQLVRYLP